MESTPPEASSPPPSYEAIRDAGELHRPGLKQMCFRIVGNAHDAEDATNEAIARALHHRRRITQDLVGWLYGTARKIAMDIAMKRQRTVLTDSIEDIVGYDHIHQSQVRAGVNPFVRQVVQFLPEDIRNDLDLYLEVREKDASEQEQADRLGIPVADVKARRRKVRNAVHYAGFVACLIADPGEGPNLCAVPFAYAKDEAASPELLQKIRAHIRKCGICRGKQGEPRSLIHNAEAAILPAISALALTQGLLHKIWKTVTAKPALAGAAAMTTGVGAVVGVLLIPRSAQHQPGMPVQPVRTSTPSAITTETTTEAISTPPDPPAATATSAIPGPSELPPAPPPALSVPSGSGGVGRDGRPPSIGQARVEHKRIAATRSRCDEDAPTTSGVMVPVTAPGGIRSVTLIMRLRGRVVERPMVGLGNAWFGQVGPFPEEDAGQVEITVRAVGTNDAETTQRIGTVCVTRCAGDSSDPADDEW